MSGLQMRAAPFQFIASIVIAGLTSFWATPVQADKHVEASMISDVSAISAGKPFDVGIKLKMVPNWHTYWSNPGDAGLATSVKWTLPPGFSARPLQFPVPTRFDEPGGIVVYGYTGEVLLISTITPPADLMGQASVQLAAKVNWLCCADICVPGAATLQTKLAIADHTTPANAEIFDHWRSHQPTTSNASVTPMHLTDDHPHAEIFVNRSITDARSIIPGAVDGLIVTVGGLKPETRNGVSGTVIPIAGQVLKGQTITDKQFIVLLTGPDASQNGRVGEAVSIPLETSTANSSTVSKE